MIIDDNKNEVWLIFENLLDLFQKGMDVRLKGNWFIY